MSRIIQPTQGRTHNIPCMYRMSSIRCSKERSADESKLQICDGCPRWSMDLIYEEIYGRRIEQTYEWWRHEWITYGTPSALVRMVELVGQESSKKPVEAPRQVYLPKLRSSQWPELTLTLSTMLVVLLVISLAIAWVVGLVLTLVLMPVP